MEFSDLQCMKFKIIVLKQKVIPERARKLVLQNDVTVFLQMSTANEGWIFILMLNSYIDTKL
ncbi:hypothetical protein WA1_12785 [Scytonema hofmannii PCC 7110]|uniref:Uncharacterized protein n=1 Tax=Scytonema hofmannii PCC 7110 TaxID=128403 RepID=A0A139XE53_9CYAN|nr:hypothetical protein WA1_12785 [Scytonema hofmannii PCC 7110]